MGKSVGPIFLMVDCPARDKGGSAGTFLWAANFVQLFVRQQQNVKDASQPRALCGFITRRTTHWETLRQALPWFTWAKQGQARPSKAWVNAQGMVALLAPLGDTCRLPRVTMATAAE